jgi:DNA invertase Pin-like site-specific DNA recombinase
MNRISTARRPAKATAQAPASGPRVYSYIRFSSMKQAAGTSGERQMQYAVTWAARHKLPLDTALTLRDEGLSAWSGANIEKGALGAFLQAVERGAIAPGSVLVVESLDRLSRATVDKALSVLLRIIHSGLRVVTANDDKEYSEASIAKSPLDLMVSLTIMMRANEESNTKSDRVQRALRARCQGWLDGKWRGNLRAGRDPSWVTWTGARFELNAEVVAILLAMIELFEQGYGPRRIADTLTERGITPPWGIAHQQRFYEIIRNRALIGERSIAVMGETFVLPGYYPAALSVEHFERLQYLMSGRSRRGTGVKGAIPPLLTGLRMCTCGHCNWAMAAQNTMKRQLADGSLPDSARRMYCSGLFKPSGCRVNASMSAVPIERAVLEFCADQFNLDALRQSDAGAATLAARIAKVRAERAAVERQIGNITDAIAEGGKLLRPLAAKLNELEDRREALAVDIMAMEREYASVSAAEHAADSGTWRALIDGCEALEFDARMKVRALVAETFERIVIYIDGVGRMAPGYVDIEVVSRQGVYRIIRVDRKSGAWAAGEQIDMLAPLPTGEGD